MSDVKQPDDRNSEENIMQPSYDWLLTCPPGDYNFKHNLNIANTATIRAVLNDLIGEGNATRRKVLEVRLRKLEKKNKPAATAAKSDQVYIVELSRIVVSPTEAQAIRREGFIKNELIEIGTSIKINGLQQPILCRPDGDKLQVIYGERRFLGSQLVGLATIRCFIAEKTDAEVLKLQYVENHGRKESSPRGDALIFKNLIETEGYTISRIADELGTSPQNITERLKLNDLIPEAVAQLEAKKLPVRHAYFMALLPADAQAAIVKQGYAYHYNQIEYGAVAYRAFQELVRVNVTRRLAEARFDPEDPRLHMTGLPCSKCTERTGYNNLFEEISKEDSCLNQQCWQFKTNINLRLKRDEIAATLPNPENKPLDEMVKKVPLLTEHKYVEATPFREKVRTEAKTVARPECEFSTPALDLDKGRQTWTKCANENCEIHFPKPAPAEIDEAALLQKKAAFKRKIAYLTRRRILENGRHYFDDYKVFWQFDDLVRQLIASFLETIQSTADDLLYIVRDWKSAPAHFRSRAEIDEFVSTLDKRQLSQLLFLLANKEQLYPLADASTSTIEKISIDYTKEFYGYVREARPCRSGGGRRVRRRRADGRDLNFERIRAVLNIRRGRGPTRLQGERIDLRMNTARGQSDPQLIEFLSRTFWASWAKCSAEKFNQEK